MIPLGYLRARFVDKCVDVTAPPATHTELLNALYALSLTDRNFADEYLNLDIANLILEPLGAVGLRAGTPQTPFPTVTVNGSVYCTRIQALGKHTELHEYNEDENSNTSTRPIWVFKFPTKQALKTAWASVVAGFTPEVVRELEKTRVIEGLEIHVDISKVETMDYVLLSSKDMLEEEHYVDEDAALDVVDFIRENNLVNTDDCYYPYLIPEYDDDER